MEEFYRIFAKNGLSADDSDFLTSLAFWKAFQNLIKPRTKEESARRFVSRLVSLSFPLSPRSSFRSEITHSPKRLIPSPRTNRLSIRTHSEVEDPERVTRESGDLVHRRVLPDADLVLDRTCRVAVGGDDLVGGFRPEEVADLGKGSEIKRDGEGRGRGGKGGGGGETRQFQGFMREGR